MSEENSNCKDVHWVIYVDRPWGKEIRAHHVLKTSQLLVRELIPETIQVFDYFLDVVVIFSACELPPGL